MPVFGNPSVGGVTAIEPNHIPSMTIRELTELVPETIEVLAPFGIDLCCGGAHELGKALDLHGVDRNAVLPEITRLVAYHQARRRGGS